jgi:hypothetical protein
MYCDPSKKLFVARLRIFMYLKSSKKSRKLCDSAQAYPFFFFVFQISSGVHGGQTTGLDYHQVPGVKILSSGRLYTEHLIRFIGCSIMA